MTKRKKQDYETRYFILLLTTFWGVFVEAGNNKEVPVSKFESSGLSFGTIDPYISAWSHTDKLYEDEVRHWTGTEHSLTGVLRVDGKMLSVHGKRRTGFNFNFERCPRRGMDSQIYEYNALCRLVYKRV